MWEAILAIIASVLKLFAARDPRDVSHDQGEKVGVAETQAAAAQHSVEEARQSNANEEDVHRLTDQQLDDELRNGPGA